MSRQDLGDGHQADYYSDYLDSHGLRDGTADNAFEFDDPPPFPRTRFPPDEINAMHANSDNDSSQLAQHHTLGPRHNQASPGDHSHDGITSKNIGAWTEYVNNTNAASFWTCASGANPVIGNGTVEARYCKIGNLCYVTWYMVFGTTTTLGGGVWIFGLPFAPKLPVSSTSGMCGAARAFINGPFRVGAVFFSGVASTVSIVTDNQANYWQASTPQAWGSSNQYTLEFSIFYETIS